MLGKTFKGLTDAMLTWQTERLLALADSRQAASRERGRFGVVRVRPELVAEIAFDGVQASRRYPGGVTLRFARVLRYREDKRPPRPTRSTWSGPCGRTLTTRVASARSPAAAPQPSATCHDLSMRTVWLDEDGRWHTRLRGRQVLTDPRLNRGTAFSYPERHELGVTGLVPPAHVTLDQQVARVYAQYLRQPDDLARNVLLTEVHDRNEVLFYRLLIQHLPEMLPIVYTPTVGQAIKSYSHEYRRPRGVYLSVDHPELIEESLLRDRPGGRRTRPDRGDRRRGDPGHRRLGRRRHAHRGRQAGGLHRCGRHRPEPVRAVMLDVGTDRQSLLEDPLYIGNRHPRVPADEYDGFLDAFVETATQAVPARDAALGGHRPGNARRLLDRYRDRLLTFNDDIQGTGAVNLAAVLAAVRATGTSADRPPDRHLRRRHGGDRHRRPAARAMSPAG